jgi:hypothetical protein
LADVEDEFETGGSNRDARRPLHQLCRFPDCAGTLSGEERPEKSCVRQVPFAGRSSGGVERVRDSVGSLLLELASHG